MKTCLAIVLLFSAVAHGTPTPIERVESSGRSDMTKHYLEFERRCRAGNGEACAHAGDTYYTGFPVKDRAKAASFFEQGCDLDNSGSCESWGLVQRDGEGVKKDLVGALRALRKACDLGSVDACRTTGGLYAGGGDGVKASKVDSVIWLDRACTAGDERSCGLYKLALDCKASDECFGMAELLRVGYPAKHVAKDPDMAAIFYAKACHLRHAEACDDLAACYAQGIGVSTDLWEADRVQKRACDLGNKHACAGVRMRHK